jgi:SAM-dependent methyltransferase
VNRTRYRAWGFVDAADPASEPEIAALGAQLSRFYAAQAVEQRYWEHAEAGNEIWGDSTHPYHRHLAARVTSGNVVDFGCGSAHALRNLPAGIEYIGIEGSEVQVARDRERFPHARFICGDMTQDQTLSGSADWCISLFAIEHCVRPDLLLARMVDTCKPGGRVAIVCPECHSGMNSLVSGFSALPKKDKLRRLQLVDVLASYVQERWIWPRRTQALQRDLEFPIYLTPRCFNAPYFSDNDAVYLASEAKLACALERLGCRIEARSNDVPETDAMRGSIAYLVARKAV